MQQEQRPLFRESALKHYLQKRERDILPRLVSPPTFICAWILLCLITIVGVVAWLQKVPVFMNSLGIVQSQEQDHGQIIRLFLHANEAGLVHVGEVSQLQIGLTGPHLTGKIVRIEPGLLSPDDVHSRYAVLPAITDPVAAVDVNVAPSMISPIYAGSPVSAQIQIGTTRVLSFIPGLDILNGD